MSHRNHRRKDRPPRRPSRPYTTLERTSIGFYRDRPDLGPSRIEYVETERCLVRIQVGGGGNDQRGRAIGRSKWKRWTNRSTRHERKVATRDQREQRKTRGSPRGMR